MPRNAPYHRDRSSHRAGLRRNRAASPLSAKAVMRRCLRVLNASTRLTTSSQRECVKFGTGSIGTRWRTAAAPPFLEPLSTLQAVASRNLRARDLHGILGKILPAPVVRLHAFPCPRATRSTRQWHVLLASSHAWSLVRAALFSDHQSERARSTREGHRGYGRHFASGGATPTLRGSTHYRPENTTPCNVSVSVICYNPIHTLRDLHRGLQ